MLSVGSVIESRDMSLSNDFYTILKTEGISDSDGVFHSELLVPTHCGASIFVRPDRAFGGILSTISVRYKLSNAGFIFQDIRFFDLREDEYPDLVSCFVVNMSKQPFILSVEESYFYQWFQSAQYL